MPYAPDALEQRKRKPATIGNMTAGDMNPAAAPKPGTVGGLPSKPAAAQNPAGGGTSVMRDLATFPKIVGNAVKLPLDMAADGARNTIGSAFGVPVNNPTKFQDQAFGNIREGLSDIGAAGQRVADAARPYVAEAVNGTREIPAVAPAQSAQAAASPAPPKPAAAPVASALAPAFPAGTVRQPGQTTGNAFEQAARGPNGELQFSDGKGAAFTKPVSPNAPAPLAATDAEYDAAYKRLLNFDSTIKEVPSSLQSRTAQPAQTVGQLSAQQAPQKSDYEKERQNALEIGELEIGSGTAYGSLGYDPSNRGSQRRAAKAQRELRQKGLDNRLAGNKDERDAAQAASTIGEAAQRMRKGDLEARGGEMALARQAQVLELQDQIGRLPESDPRRAELVNRLNVLNPSSDTGYEFKTVDRFDDQGIRIGQDLYAGNPKTGQGRIVNQAKTAIAPPAVGPRSVDDFLSKARIDPRNKGKSDEELKAFYEQKYGAR